MRIWLLILVSVLPLSGFFQYLISTSKHERNQEAIQDDSATSRDNILGIRSAAAANGNNETGLYVLAGQDPLPKITEITISMPLPTPTSTPVKSTRKTNTLTPSFTDTLAPTATATPTMHPMPTLTRMPLPTTRATTPPATTTPKPEATANAVPNVVEKILLLTNQERAKAGVAPLSLNPKLSEIAKKHSQDMADRNYFNHTSKEGPTSSRRIKSSGLHYTKLAENIVENKSIEAAFQSWMDSPGHRKNILSNDYRFIGIGVAKDEKGYYYITQDFIN